MKFSESWLREWVNPDINTAQLIEQMTMAGLEVDGSEALDGEFSSVVVGEIITVEPHPDADKLKVCQVSAGKKSGAGKAAVAQVVCGAANVRVGLKVPFATVGAVLPNNVKIKKTKLRGVASAGMLCAQTELNLGEDDSGLWELSEDAPVGKSLQDYLNLNDTVIDIDLTPNRSDCLSIKGIARDIGVLNRTEIRMPEVAAAPVLVRDTFPVAVQASAQCPRYAGRVVRNINPNSPSPMWLQERLRRSDVRSLDAVVDVTNYVLLELGQPMHAFDLNKLKGGIVVRMAEKGETLTLLNGQQVSLNPDTLVIADADRVIAMAGIMGGEATAVDAETRDVFLESAFFSPLAIAGRARNFGLHTDSSHRFERGVDFQLQVQALERATALLLEIAGGEAGPLIIEEKADDIPTDRRVTLRRQRIHEGLGFEMEDGEVKDILTRLGLKECGNDDNGWTFSVPSYRFDIAIEEDLLEELARVYGYNRLPTTTLQVDLAIQPKIEALVGLPAIRQQLVARGFQEAITYSFVEPGLQSLFDPKTSPVGLLNPISADMAVMRTSLWPGLIQALQHSLNRQQERVRLFETGLRFVPSTTELLQEPVLAGLAYGARYPESWSAKTEKSDFFDLKGDLESLLVLTGEYENYSFVGAEHTSLHPGQSAAIVIHGRIVGYIGAIHPKIQQQLGLNQAVYLFEVLQSGITQARLPDCQDLSRFPEIRRDVALIIDQSIAVDSLLKAVRSQAGAYLRELKVFDVYVGKGIDPHRKSVALGLTFQHPSRTLNEDEINASLDVVIRCLEVEFDAILR